VQEIANLAAVEDDGKDDAVKATEEPSTPRKEEVEEIPTAGSAAEAESLTDAPSGAANHDSPIDLSEVRQSEVAALTVVTSEKTQPIEAQSQLGSSSNSVASPVSKKNKKKNAQKAAELAAKPVAEPAAKSVEEPAVKPVAEPAVKPVEEPVAKPVEEPIVKPVEEPAAKPVQEPVVKPVEKPTVEEKSNARDDLSGENDEEVNGGKFA